MKDDSEFMTEVKGNQTKKQNQHEGVVDRGVHPLEFHKWKIRERHWWVRDEGGHRGREEINGTKYCHLTQADNNVFRERNREGGSYKDW
jgi:hypothetical protein